jgi:hypothetical protein
MEMQGSRTLAVSQQQAWDGLNDPEVLKASIPGCEKVERTGEHSFDVGVAVKVGPVSARFKGRITLSDIHPPERYALTFDGQGGPAGFGKGTAQVRLAAQPEGCELHYSVHAQVGGKIAQVGQRLIDGVARSMAEDFFRRFEQEMQRRHPAAAPAAAPPPAPAAPARTIPAWTWIIAAAIAVAAGLWLLR